MYMGSWTMVANWLNSVANHSLHPMARLKINAAIIWHGILTEGRNNFTFTFLQVCNLVSHLNPLKDIVTMYEIL